MHQQQFSAGAPHRITSFVPCPSLYSQLRKGQHFALPPILRGLVASGLARAYST